MDIIDLPNEELAQHLFEISELYKIENDTYRSKVFREAAEKIELYPDELTSGQEVKDKIGKGIGISIMEVIDELKNSEDHTISKIGTSKRLEELKLKHLDRVKIIDEFMKIHGIGPVTANKYYDMGIRTIDELWYKAPLTKAQKLSIYYRNHTNIRIPRDEVDWVNKYLLILFPKLQIEIVGSYRRGEITSGDIDILIKKTNNIELLDIVNILIKEGLVIGTLALGDNKFLGLIKIGERPVRRLDLLLINVESWGSALLYFTGSQRFNILTRQRAKDLGLRLNEYGLYDQHGNRSPTTTEEDIFNLLNMQWIPPNERIRNIIKL